MSKSMLVLVVEKIVDYNKVIDNQIDNYWFF
jgi:hypothetical protein